MLIQSFVEVSHCRGNRFLEQHHTIKSGRLGGAQGCLRLHLVECSRDRYGRSLDLGRIRLKKRLRNKLAYDLRTAFFRS